jgi:cobalt-zinc-cadmium efflux system outer membrane protein
MKRIDAMLAISIFALMCMSSVSLASVLAAEPTTDQDAAPTFELPDILGLVLEHNPLVLENQGILEEKKGKKISASAYPNPTVNFNSGRGTVLDPANDISITERSVILSQPFEWPGKREARQHAAQAGVEGAAASKEAGQLQLISATKQGFYNLLLAQHQLDMAMRNLQTIKEVREAIIRRVEAGEAPPFEAIKINVEGMKVQKEVVQVQGVVKAFRAALNSLTAGNLGSDFSVKGEFAVWPGSLHLETLSQQALMHHPVILKWEKLVEEAQQAHRLERQARVPDVTVYGSYQRDAGREAYLGGVSVPVPIWNQRQGEIAQAKGLLRQQEAGLLRAKHELLKNIAQQVQLSQTAAAQITTYEKGLVKQAQEALRIAQTSFKFGEASLLDVLDAQRVLRQTLLDYAQAKYDLSVALAELERLTGGIALP